MLGKDERFMSWALIQNQPLSNVKDLTHRSRVGRTPSALANSLAMALHACALEGMAREAAAEVEGREITMSPEFERHKRDVASRRHVVTRDAEITGVAGRAGFPVQRGQAAVGPIREAEAGVGPGRHRAVASGALVLAGVHEVPVTHAALAVGIACLLFVVEPEALAVNNRRRHGVGRPWAQLRAHGGVTHLAVLGQVLGPHQRRIVMAARALPHGRARRRHVDGAVSERGLVTRRAVDRRPVPALEVTAVVEGADVEVWVGTGGGLITHRGRLRRPVRSTRL